MKIGEKQILAWLDGELDEAGAQEVEQAVQSDPVLMARAEAHFLTMMQLKAAFAPLLDAPFPNGSSEVPQSSPESADAAEPDLVENVEEVVVPPVRDDVAAVAVAAGPHRRTRRIGDPALGRAGGDARAGRGHRPLPSGFIATAGCWPERRRQRAGGETVRDQDGALVAAGALADALENGLAPGDAEPVHIPLSFREKTGKLCRSFDTAQLAGIACRDDDGWRLRLALQTGRGGGSAASESPFIGQAVDAMIAGDPLDAGQQQAARGRGWR